MDFNLRSLFRKAAEISPETAALFRAFRDERLFHKQQTVITPFGFKFCGHPSMQSGDFEPDETDMIRYYLSMSDVFIDIGANIGFYTCIAAYMGKYAVAVEPLPDNLRMLFKNIEENKFAGVEIWPIALAEKPGIMTIYGGGTGASLIKGWAGISQKWAQKITVNTLDNLLSHRFKGKQLLIKIDVEGAEFNVFKGAEKTLTLMPRPIWLAEITLNIHRIEINPHFFQTFEMFWDNGYEARTADSERKLITPEHVKNWAFAGKCQKYNWLFIAPEKNHETIS